MLLEADQILSVRIAEYWISEPQKEKGMPSFKVRFIKTVCDDTGGEHRACQAAFKVDAASLSAAAQQAETHFCRQKSVSDWTSDADVLELRTSPA
ncbi:hypothetical protein [Bradyrhizobium sp. CCBAU 53380]|uniref:hypothetical protein n=1 Tax=Bradyrhizobium sp. CCBAU 53380 TaxID=1325117 RepID=UPI002302A090|nr:hypothetical protein [Bradyrhizobium sp. CCBAU 53380]